MNRHPILKKTMAVWALLGVVLLIVRPLTWRRWLLGFAAGAVWLIIWYAPVSIWIGVLLEFLILWGLRQAFRTPIVQKPPQAAMR